ncbi:MAG: caspase family protein [Prevotella sp.]|nr:caspase family protein [Prevotella sp.]
MKVVITLIVTCLLSLSFLGCKINNISVPEAKSTNTYVVVVGLETSKFAGSCPGAGYDADRMYKLLAQFSPNIVLLRDSNATKANVASALSRAVENAKEGLVIFSYSGHGGSEPFKDTGMEEADGSDEFLCLYDTYMRDNEIWDIISKSNGRIFMIYDCCHSQTLYRNVGFKVRPPLSWDYRLNEQKSFSMLCWSGCPDNTYSYGASNGGQFTNALLRHFGEHKTYEGLWNEIKNDRTLRSYENPQSTVLGKGFDGKKIFR